MKNKRADFLSSIYRPPLKKDNRRNMVCLDKNESAFSAFESVSDVFDDKDISKLHLYPDPYETYKKLADFLNVDINNLLITHGSEQILSFIFHSFLEKGDKVVFPNPSYAMYSVYAQEIEADIIYLDYNDDMGLDLQTIVSSIDQTTSLFVLANPDNHTGASLSLEDIEHICQKTEENNTIFLLDEAYYYYIEIDTISLLEKYKNLVITRSCSKACGLAGARIGYGISNKSIIDILRVYKPMHEMNSLNGIVFNKFLDDPSKIIDKNVQQVVKWKKAFKSISNDEITYVATDTNYIIVKVSDKKLYNTLDAKFVENNIAVRVNFSHSSMRDCIRFSVGTDDVMERVFEILNISSKGWLEKDTLNFYINSRTSYDELYDSERYFLSKEYIRNLDSVLDVGCATGNFYEIFGSINRHIRYTGIDISKEAIKYAKSRHKDKANFVDYSGSLPLPVTEKHSLVYCSGLLHLIDSYKEILKNMFSLSKDNILFDLRLSNEPTYSGKYYFDFANTGDRENCTNYYVVNGKEILSFLLEQNFFSSIDIYGYEGKANSSTNGVTSQIFMVFFKCTISDIAPNQTVVNYNSKVSHLFEK